MSIGKPAKSSAIRFLAMALIALAPLLFGLDASPWSVDLPAVSAAHDIQPAEPDDDEQETTSAEAEPALPIPVSAMTWLPRHAQPVPATQVYLPPDTLPLLPPPRQMARA